MRFLRSVFTAALFLGLTAIAAQFYAQRPDHRPAAAAVERLLTPLLREYGMSAARLNREQHTPRESWRARWEYWEKEFFIPHPLSEEHFLAALRQLVAAPLAIAAISKKKEHAQERLIIDLHSHALPVYRLIVQYPIGLKPAVAPLPAPPAAAIPARPPPPAVVPPPPPRPPEAQLAIVLDDWGNNASLITEALQLPQPVTYAILPNLAFSTTIAERLSAEGQEYILHQPIEPHNPERLSLEANTLHTGMPAEQIRMIVRENIAQLGNIRGVNNHMGSKGTEHPALMRALLQEVKAHRLFFLDSLTSAASIGRTVAAELNIPFCQRDIFIDNENDATAIERQLLKAAELAHTRGACIAIGHARPTTVRVLHAVMPRLSRAGIRFIRLSALVEHRGNLIDPQTETDGNDNTRY
ncbi:MAG: divergent polysaccharide deacetylase family protein [Candidatus Omnitrophica bacterium]|nr:divergent polysaccharide deacetylase family protein [Candidatus Omnitrophota bacterium]